MLRKKSRTMAKNYDQDSPSINIIRSGTEITGDVKCAGDIRIDGKLTGTLKSEGKVVVGKSGYVEGEINCHNADISGKVHARIAVQELLQLKSTANLEGEIQTKKLAIEPGAKFTGACNMGAEVKKEFKQNGQAAKKEEGEKVRREGQPVQ